MKANANPWVIGTAAAVGLGAAWLSSRPLKGVQVPKVSEPGWSSRLRKLIEKQWPGAWNVTGGAFQQIKLLKEKWGTTTVDGVEVPKAPYSALKDAHEEWSFLLMASDGGSALGATKESKGFKWVYGDLADYWDTAGLLGSLVDPAANRRYMRELAELVVDIDVADEDAPANPDNRGYWDFFWARAGNLVALPLELAWDVFGPLAKMLGVVLLVAVVGGIAYLYVVAK